MSLTWLTALDGYLFTGYSTSDGLQRFMGPMRLIYALTVQDGSGEFAALRSDEGLDNEVYGANLFLEIASELIAKRFLAGKG